MFSKLRKRLTYTNVAMTLALVFAMTGGAYAASKFVITSTKQIKPSVLKQLQGKAGKAGAAGANGTNGTNGAPGTPGEKGAAGTNGTNGKDGAPGTNGKDGKEGSPWTLGGTLPTGKTETGTWATLIGKNTIGFALGMFSISFNIPLAAALPEASVKIEPEEFPIKNSAECNAKPEPEKAACLATLAVEEEECPGNASEAKAAAGKLCVYTTSDPAARELVKVATTVPGGVVIVIGTSTAHEGLYSFGTWAVTAP